MPKKIGAVDKSVLINAPLPPKTKTYTVISHQYAIDTIQKAMTANGFEIESEEYRCATGAKVATGTFIVNYAEDEDLKMMYAFNNSYDKSLRFRASIGASITANDSYMIDQMDQWNRKHTGTADDETEALINQHITNAKEYFSQLLEAKDSMKQIYIDKRTFGQILGELFITDCLTIDQVSVIAKEYANPSFTYTTGANNLWTCYNHIVHALRSSHPSNWMQNQIAIHMFFLSRYDLVKFDPEPIANIEVPENEELVVTAEGDVEIPNINKGIEILAPEDVVKVEEVVEEIVEEVLDPAQIDLETQIAEEEQQELQEEKDIKKDLYGTEQYGEENVTPVATEMVEPPIIDTPVANVEEEVTLPSMPVGELVETDVAEEEKPEIYLPQSDLPGKVVGDLIEIEEDFYEIMSAESIEGVDHFECKCVTVEDLDEEVQNELNPEETPSEEPDVTANIGGAIGNISLKDLETLQELDEPESEEPWGTEQEIAEIVDNSGLNLESVNVPSEVSLPLILRAVGETIEDPDGFTVTPVKLVTPLYGAAEEAAGILPEPVKIAGINSDEFTVHPQQNGAYVNPEVELPTTPEVITESPAGMTEESEDPELTVPTTDFDKQLDPIEVAPETEVAEIPLPETTSEEPAYETGAIVASEPAPVLPSKTEVDEAVKNVIGQELEMLFGYTPDKFTFKLNESGEIYDITLIETGETCQLAASYIDSLA